MQTKLVMSFLLIGAFFIAQGCTTPLVDVKVTNCSQDETKSLEGEGKGACNVYPAGTTQYTGPAYGFYIVGTSPAQFYTGNGNCSGLVLYSRNKSRTVLHGQR